MNIKEFYITDLDAGSDDFWSADKIIKLNENFNALAGGLPQGQPGVAGYMGTGGGDGTAGVAGETGVTGDDGTAGINGLNIWERIEDTPNTKLKQRLDNSCVILGLGNTAGAIVQTSTFVEGGGTIKPSVLRVHALNKHNTGIQRNHIHFNSPGTGDINFREHADSKVLNGYFDIYGSELGTELSPNHDFSISENITGWEAPDLNVTVAYQYISGSTNATDNSLLSQYGGSSTNFWFKSTDEIAGLVIDKTYVITGEVLVSTTYSGTGDIYLTTNSEFGTYEYYTTADPTIQGNDSPANWQKLTTYFTTDTDVAGRVYAKGSAIVNNDWLAFRNISIRDLQWDVPDYTTTQSSAVLAVEDGALKITNASDNYFYSSFARQAISYTAGKDYEVKFSLKDGYTAPSPAPAVNIYVRSKFDSSATNIVSGLSLTDEWVDYTYTFTATAASVDISIANGTWGLASTVGEYFYIDNVSVKEVESPSASIASQNVTIKSSNININESMYLTDSGIVLDPDTSPTVNGPVNFGKITPSNIVHVDIIGDVTIPTVAGSTITGYAIASAGFSNIGAGSGDKAISFYNISDSYNSFPYGSIISISTKEYDENFENDYTDELNNTGTNSQGGQGFESIHGRGTGNYEGWYLCNGMKWQDIHVTNSPAFFDEIVPKLNTTNYDVNGTNLPSTPDISDYSVTGAQLNITTDSSDITINETGGLEGHQIMIGGATEWDYASTHSSGGDLNINNKIFVIWLGTEYPLYWYTQPFSNQDEEEMG